MNWEQIFGDALRAAFGPTAAAYALAAVGLNVHYGYTGLLNFGQVGFMLVGAYGLGITVATLGLSFWVGLLVGLAAGAVLGLLLGIPTLRLRADYFAITTIAVAEVLRILARSRPLTDVTGGPFGLQGIAAQFYALNPFHGGRYGFGSLSYPRQQFWIMVVGWLLVLVATLLVWLLMRSPWGRVLRSIREDEDAARSLGKNVFAYKMQSLVLGGVIAAAAGLVFATAGQTVNSESYMPQVTFFLYTILILGGAASTIGPIAGTIVFWFLVQGIDVSLRQAQRNGLLPDFIAGADAVGATSLILVGLGLMLLMIFRPQGMFGKKREMLLDV